MSFVKNPKSCPGNDSEEGYGDDDGSRDAAVERKNTTWAWVSAYITRMPKTLSLSKGH